MKCKITVFKGEKRSVAQYESNDYGVSLKYTIDDDEISIEETTRKAFMRIQEVIHEKQLFDGINPHHPKLNEETKAKAKPEDGKEEIIDKGPY